MEALWEELVAAELCSNMTVRLLQFVLFRHADKEDGCCFDCQPVVVLFAIVAFVILVLVVFVVMAFYQLPEVRKDSTVAQTPDCCSQLGDLVVVDCWYENSSTIESQKNTM